MDAQVIIQNLVITMPIFLLSLSVHEAAHAAAADYLGDPTARYQGRVTLNPLSHIDWIGTVLMPVLSAFSGGIAMIGWAKPVPVDWRNLRNVRRDDTIIAIAGPASNVVLSFVCFLGLAALLMANVGTEPGSIGALVVKLFRYGIIINIALAVFNMIPIPPLDGSHVVANALPEHLSEKYRSIGFYGVFLLLILLNFTPLKTLLNLVIRTIDGGYVHLLNTVVGG